MTPSFKLFTQTQYRKLCSLTQHVTNPANKYQIYISRSLDPYLNLSIEHYLLQNSPAESTVLFLYINSPSIILGRNQNPWNEVNLGLLRHSALGIQLVRRRSGGGTVFHDEGNVNYSVICPTSEFHRDKHAEMVVRALKLLGSEKVWVNERHDIVLDKSDESKGRKDPFKISGSAYKLTKFRSLHHGTCLLFSPHLKLISKFLDSPAKPFLKTRGVNSVSSKITNVGLTNTAFQTAVIDQFCSMYSAVEPAIVDDEVKEIPEIAKGLSELKVITKFISDFSSANLLKSNDWVYGQTPSFTFTYDSSLEFPLGSGKTSSQVWSLPESFHLEFAARHGRIIDASTHLIHLLNQNLHEITDWRLKSLTSVCRRSLELHDKVGTMLKELFGSGGNILINHKPSEHTQ